MNNTEVPPHINQVNEFYFIMWARSMKSEPAQPYITLLQLLSVLEYHKFIF